MPTAAGKPDVTRSNQLIGRVFGGSSRRRPAEDQSVRLANEIPGFGGIFFNSSHELVAYVKDTTTGGTMAASAIAALRAHLSSDGFGVPLRIRPRTVKTLRADYDWQTLSTYRDFISDSLMGRAGVVIVAIDVAINRVSVTVASTNPTGVSDLTQALNRRHIPPAAINIIRGSAPRHAVASTPSVASYRRFTPTFSTLQDDEPDSLMGGIRIGVPADGGGKCTIGAVVDSAGTTKLLSASHCSRIMWNLGGDSVTTFQGDLIGHETTDLGSSVSCDGFHFCIHHRGSDDALWSMDATYGAAHARLGVIARTTSRDSSGLTGTIHTSLNSSNPFLYVYDTLSSSNLFVGEEVDKIGERSGWQKGQIFKVCADYWEDSSDEFYCATEVYALIMFGDSGGPVFIWDGMDGAVMAGTTNDIDVNYAQSDSGGVAGFFSNWSAIVTENGPIDPRPVSLPTVGTPSLSGSVSGGDAVASWSAVSTTNTTSTTQYKIYESTWDASTNSWTELNQYIGTTTSLSYTDASAPWTIYAATGDTQADECPYSSVGIQIVAYNRGVISPSSTIWFQGLANGPPGGGTCLASRAPRRGPGG